MIGMVVHPEIKSQSVAIFFLSEETIQLELLSNCLTIFNAKLSTNKRETNSGYLMEQFFAWPMAGTHPENS